VESWPPALLIVLGALALAVVTILGLFVLALLFVRYLQWKMPDWTAIERQIQAILAQRQDEIRRWQQRHLLFGLLWFSLLVFLLLIRRWNLVVTLLSLALPSSLIFSGISTLKSGFMVENMPFLPVRLLTTEQAKRRGVIMIAVGLLSLLPCVPIAISAAFPNLH
jgi:hypothetical protein